MPTLKELADALAVRDEEQRILGDTPIAVCGPVGGIFEDLEMRLALPRLSPSAKDAAIELVDSGAVHVADDGRLFVARLPTGPAERRLVRKALGLTPKREDQ